MAQRAFKQFNEEDIAVNWNYLQLPLYFCNKTDLSPSHALQAGAIVSYSNPRKGTADCTRTHKGFSEELHCSTATSTRGIKVIKELTEDGVPLLEILKQSTYRIDKSKLKSRQIIPIEKCILYHTFEFTDDDSNTTISRPLTKHELFLFSYIAYKWKHLKNRKKGIVASYADFVKVIGGCEKTIGKEIDNLINCGLITRPKHEKGLNGRWKSVYHPDSKLLDWIDDVRKKAIKDRKKKISEPSEESEVKAAQLSKARREYYTQIQIKAEQSAERNKKIANKDNEYVKASSERLDIILMRGKYGTLSPIELEHEELKRTQLIAQALRRYGLTEDDLQPKCKCSKCNDTGTVTATGQPCDCFPEANFTDLLD